MGAYNDLAHLKEKITKLFTVSSTAILNAGLDALIKFIRHRAHINCKRSNCTGLVFTKRKIIIQLRKLTCVIPLRFIGKWGSQNGVLLIYCYGKTLISYLLIQVLLCETATTTYAI